MTTTTPGVSRAHAVGGIRRLIQSWELHLDALNLSASTQRNYLAAARALADFLESNGMPADVAHVSREHLESFLIDVRARAASLGRTDGSSTANTRRAALLQFFAYLCDEEGERTDNPVVRIPRMKEPEAEIPIIADGDIRALLKAVSGTSFYDRRDRAIISAFFDTGVRLAELVVHCDAVDVRAGEISVVGKGRKARTVPLGRVVAQASRSLPSRARDAQGRRLAHVVARRSWGR